MSRKEGVISVGKGATPQEELGNNSKGGLTVARSMATIEEKFSGLDKRFEEIKGHLTRLEQSGSAGQAGVQEEKSDERVTSATEAGREEISQSEQQQHQGPSSSKSEQQFHHHHQQQQQQHQWLWLSHL